jgi:uncharacterized protein YbjT (DUF2867 family)
MLTAQQNQALSQIVLAVTDAIRTAGECGVPGGTLYSALMAHGCSYSQFTSLMGALERIGKVRRKGHCYFIA